MRNRCDEPGQFAPQQRGDMCAFVETLSRNGGDCGLQLCRLPEAGPGRCWTSYCPSQGPTRYIEAGRPVQLRWGANVKVASADLPTLNFGRAKGLGFDRILIYPTARMVSWLMNPQIKLEGETRAKLYVALTRARHVVAVVHDIPHGQSIPGFSIYD